MKKFLSILLAAVMMICIAAPAFAEEEASKAVFTADASNTAPVADGVIGDGEYDAAIAIDITDDNYILSRNNAWGGEHDTKGVSVYVDLDQDNLYFAAKVVDGVRNDGVENTMLRMFFYLATGKEFTSIAAGQTGVLAIEVRKNYGDAVDFTSYVGYNSILDAMTANTENTEYAESTNEDGTVNEVFEMVISRDEFIEITGYDFGEVLYLRAGADLDNADEVIQTRLFLGQKFEEFEEFEFTSTGLGASDVGSTLVGNGFFKINITGVAHRCSYVFEEVEGGHQGVCECGQRAEEILDHVWDTGIITKDATVDEDGELLYTCYDCGAEKTEVIAKLDPPADETPEEPTEEPTEEPAEEPTEDEPTDDAKSGCGASITVMGLALVATLGLGVTVLSKKN